MNPLLDALSTAGYVLDTPGAYLRGALAGAPGTRASGRELLRAHGLDSPDDPWGGVKGFGAEMIADPLNLVGGGIANHLVGRGARALSHADDAVPLLRRLGELKAGVEDPLDALRYSYRHGVGSAVPGPVQAVARYVGDETGALRPFREVGRRTDPDYVNSLPWWHGTATTGLTPEVLDPMKTDPSGLFGRGIYKTANPNVAGGPHGYAAARMAQAGREWANNAYRRLMPDLKGSPDLANSVAGDLLGVARRFEGELGGSSGGGLADYLESRLRAGNPAWREAGEILGRLDVSPDAMRDAAERLGIRGFDLPSVPKPTVYEASTNLGKIADLDLPPTPELEDAFYRVIGQGGGGGGTRGSWGEQPASELYDYMTRFLPEDVSTPGDPVIRALREAGIDALSHTGGLRAGGGRNLHQVLISLDPNDTVSRVGRAGQITRFAPQDIDELLRRYQAP